MLPSKCLRTFLKVLLIILRNLFISGDAKNTVAKYKIEFDREACIGAAACVVSAPDFWKIVDDGKANLLQGATFNEQTKKWELVIEEKDYHPNLEAEQGCPVMAIKVTKIEG